MKTGTWVVYYDGHGTPEVGRVKSTNEFNIFVVFKCDNKWDEFENYTGCACQRKNLTIIGGQ